MTKSITVSGSPTHTVNFQNTADNERILKNEKQGTTNNNYVYIRGNNNYPIIEKANLNNNLSDRIYIYGPTGLVAIKDGSTINYIFKDHLCSIRVVVDTVGEIVSYSDYDSWEMILNGRSSNFGFANDKYKFTETHNNTM